MADGLDVIIVDDEPAVCETTKAIVDGFYTWGDTHAFTNPDKAIAYCLDRDTGLAIFIVDVFLGGKSGFFFLDAIGSQYLCANEDAIIITGNASDDVVNMCVASNVNHLLEKPIRSYALQLAVRSIVSKYLHFSRRLIQDPEYAKLVSSL